MKISIAGSFTVDPSLAANDYNPEQVVIIRRSIPTPEVSCINRKLVPPNLPTHTRSASNVIAPIICLPVWHMVIRSENGALRVDQEAKAGETVLYRHRDQAAAERFFSSANTSAHRCVKVGSPATDRKGRSVRCPIEDRTRV